MLAQADLKGQNFEYLQPSTMAGTASNYNKRRAHFTYIWKIKCALFYGWCESPEFTVQSMEMTKWNLSFFSHAVNFPSVCRIQRVEEDGGPESIEIDFEISLLDRNGSSLIEKSGRGYFKKKNGADVKQIPSGYHIFRERRAEFCPNDTLTIRCRLWRTRTLLSKSELCFASTHFDVYQCSCVWAVKGISSLKKGEERVRTLNTERKGCPKLMLTLSLVEQYGEEAVYMHLEAPLLTSRFLILAEIALLDAEGMIVHLKQTTDCINARFNSCNLDVIQKSKLMSDKAGLLSDDVLVLRCEFHLTPNNPAWSRIEDYKLMDNPDSKAVPIETNDTNFDELNETAVCPFKDIVSKFRENGTLSDVCFRAGTKSFPVHKLVLSSRSPVFRAMFTKDIKEKASKCIDIPDLDADTMNRLLLYIYEDQLQELTWEAAANLFEAADRFELLALKEKCSIFLKSILSESNACEILILADLHNDERLRKSVQGFILNNPKILYSDSWKNFKQNHSKLALETTEQIIYNMK